jgi:hypothetical protein
LKRRDKTGFPTWNKTVNVKQNGPRENEAARSIIPGKNPKTQRDVQSGRLCLATQGRKHFKPGPSKTIFNFPDFFGSGLVAVSG